MQKIFTSLVICFLSIGLNGQKSSNQELESAVEQIKAMFKTRPISIDSVREAVHEIDEKFDLDCIQKGRVFHKIGAAIQMEYKVELYGEAIDILRDSTLAVWMDCDSLDTKVMWNPVYQLIRLYEYDDRIFEAGQLIDYLELHPEILESQTRVNLNLSINSLIGSMRSESGDRVLAKQYFKKAEQYIDSITNPYHIWFKFDHFSRYASYAYDIGDYEQSVEKYEQANEVAEIDEDSLIYFCNILSPLMALKQFDRIEALIESHGSMVDHTELHNIRSYGYVQLVKFYVDTKQFDQAQLVLDKLEQLAEKDVRTIQSDYMRAKSLYLIAVGKFDVAESFLSEAVNDQIYTDQIDLFAPGNQIFDELIIDYESLNFILNDWFELKVKQFEITKDENDLIKAITLANQIQGLYQNKRSQLYSEYSQLSIVESSHRVFEKAIKLCVDYYHEHQDPKYLNQAIGWSVSHKSTVLNNMVSTNANYKRILSQEDYASVLDLERSKRNTESELISGDGFKESLNEAYLDLRSKESQLKNRLKNKYPELDNLVGNQNEISKIQQVRSNLADDVAVLDFFFGKDDLYMFSMNKDMVHVDQLPLNDDLLRLLNNIETDLYQYSNQAQLKTNAQKLYDLILKAGLNRFGKDVNRLKILADGPLHNIPLDMVWTGAEYLIQQYDVGYLYGLGQIDNSKSLKSDEYIGFGTAYSNLLNDHANALNGSDDINLAGLDFAENEIKTANQYFPGNVYLGESATKSNFIQNAPDVQGVIHTALHGMVMNENTSAILFDDRAPDMFLNSNEVYDLDLNNELTILSACYSSAGKIYKGEGVRNLTRAFLFAGSRNVIPSLWASSDVSNKEIISHFFKTFEAEQDPLKALSSAKRHYLANASPAYQHPAYWANMVLVGQVDENRSSNSILFYGLGVLLLCFLFWFYKQKSK